jgi:hypothetical protein
MASDSLSVRCIELQKALAYVKFMNRTEIIASCVNSSLSLWDLASLSRVRTYSGHVNVRNFVGMEVNGDYIVCGSESSQVLACPLASACCSGKITARAEWSQMPVQAHASWPLAAACDTGEYMYSMLLCGSHCALLVSALPASFVNPRWGAACRCIFIASNFPGQFCHRLCSRRPSRTPAITSLLPRRGARILHMRLQLHLQDLCMCCKCVVQTTI